MYNLLDLQTPIFTSLQRKEFTFLMIHDLIFFYDINHMISINCSLGNKLKRIPFCSYEMLLSMPVVGDLDGGLKAQNLGRKTKIIKTF